MMNLDIYTDEMAKSIWDKAFFMDKIPGTKCVLDFGCADASMICMLGKAFPSIDFYGYDINEDLLERARKNLCQTTANVRTVYSGSEIEQMIERLKRTYKPEEICLNFSSVLHEVFSSNCHPEGKLAINCLIRELRPRYITVRDMYFSDYINGAISEYARDELLKDVSAADYAKFVDHFGNVKTWKDMVHFLMKYQWRNNGYEDELKENYFSWNFKNLMDLVKVDDVPYTSIYDNEYMLPYYWEQWKKFMGPNMHTHAQFILRRGE